MPTDEAKNIELRTANPEFSELRNEVWRFAKAYPLRLENAIAPMNKIAIGQAVDLLNKFDEMNSRPTPSPAPQTTEGAKLVDAVQLAMVDLHNQRTAWGDTKFLQMLESHLRLALSAPSPADQGAVAEVQGIIEKLDKIGNDTSLDDFDHYFQLTVAGAQAIGYLRSHIAAVASEARLKEAETALRQIADHHDLSESTDVARAYFSPAPSPADVARDEGKECKAPADIG